MSRPIPAGRYFVVGCSRAGTSAAKALAAEVGPSQVRVWDSHDGPETRRRAVRLARLGVRVDLGPWRAGLVGDALDATIVKSPGVPLDCPPIQLAIANGTPVIDELELGHRISMRPLVAVTGTDGKSTVCALLAQALDGRGSPVPRAGNTEFGAPLSAVKRTGGPVVVEASSYQLEFCGGPFARLAVLTNLTSDHLHRHGTVERYAAAKRRLFIGERSAVPLAVVNADGLGGHALVGDLRAAGATVATAGSSRRAEYRVLETDWDMARGAIRLATPRGELELLTLLPGRHNAENVACALAACDLLGVDRARALATVQTMRGVPGRWERLQCGQPFEVVVDFAHTPAALEQVLLTARHAVASRAGAGVHLMLCAGGANNPGKRPPLGKIASSLADRVVVTEGNSHGETPEEVIAGLLDGWRSTGPQPEVVPDRADAIRRTIEGARAGDVVLLVGRGAMPRLLANAAGGGRPFDDRRVAEQHLLGMLGA